MAKCIERLLLITVNLGLNPSRVKPKTIKIGIFFLLDVQQQKGLCQASIVCGRQDMAA